MCPACCKVSIQPNNARSFSTRWNSCNRSTVISIGAPHFEQKAPPKSLLLNSRLHPEHEPSDTEGIEPTMSARPHFLHWWDPRVTSAKNTNRVGKGSFEQKPPAATWRCFKEYQFIIESISVFPAYAEHS